MALYGQTLFKDLNPMLC